MAMQSIEPERFSNRQMAGMLATRQIAQDAAEGTATHGLVRTIAAGAQIFAEGDASDRFYRIQHGVVRTCRFLNDGRRQIDAFYAEQDLFGFERDGERRLTADAVTDCTLIAYPRLRSANEPDAALHHAPELLIQALHGMARAQEHALLLGRRGAGEKLASFLLQCQGAPEGAATVRLPMSRQDIADYLGLTIETVSRTFTQLERDGVIALPAAKQVVIRNVGKLRELAA